MQRHELSDGTVPANEQVRRYAKLGNVTEERVGVGLEAIRKQPINLIAAELSRRETDAVDDDQVDVRIGWAVITIRRRKKADASKQASVSIEFHDRTVIDMY